MDFSVVAAVGSFAISERVLKPKATALFILGCILAYDLTTKTHDITSLRVYRGKISQVMDDEDIFGSFLMIKVALIHSFGRFLSLVSPWDTLKNRTGAIGIHTYDVRIFLTNMET